MFTAHQVWLVIVQLIAKFCLDYKKTGQKTSWCKADREHQLPCVGFNELCVLSTQV